MTKILVTGGAGFIGSNLVDMLLEHGYEVSVLDNLSSGKISNIPKKVEFIKGNICEPETVKSSLKDVEIIFHLAAQASVAVSMTNPLLDTEYNVKGTVNILETAYQTEIDQFIFASTGGAIYGSPKLSPPNESSSEEPISIYGTSKLVAEKYISLYQRRGLKSSILRFANVYGPRQDPHGEAGVISIFMNKIKSGKPIHVFGDGSSSRDYVFVKDVAKVAMEMIKKPYPNPINVGSGQETILNDLISVIKLIVGKDFDIIYTDKRKGDVDNIYLDCTKLKNHLGWLPSTPLETGLAEVWDWISAN